MRPCLQVGCATELPFPDHSFDVVISINTLHNLERDDLIQARAKSNASAKAPGRDRRRLSQRGKKKQRMFDWNLACQNRPVGRTALEGVVAEAGYTGDYFHWFIP